MVETAATFQRYMFSEIKIAIKLNAKIRYIMWRCDVIIKDGVGKKRVRVLLA